MDQPFNEGDLIAGKYAVERVIGDGGMGVVVAARHLELGERVALKFLLPEAAKIREACVRFVREARAAARIKGEHVARVLDVGTREDGIPFIVMEYLEGTDLGRLVETRGPLAVEDAVHYVLQACEAVAQAHALGIVHRDLKPANLFLTTNPDGSPLVKVLDFGISKTESVFARTLSPDITTVNASMGTPQYMSPEQARDAAKVDARGDVWSLGAILYELLAGTPAFDGDDLPAIVMMIATEEPPALASLRSDVPVALAAVVRRCLQKNRDDRFADIAGLARALEPFVPEHARPAVARIARILGHDSLPPPVTVEAPLGVPTRRPARTAVALALAVTVPILGGVAWSQRSSLSSLASTLLDRLPAHAAAVRPRTPVISAPKALDVSPRAPVEAAMQTPASAPAEAAPEVPPVVNAPTPGAERTSKRTRSFDPTAAARELLSVAERANDCSKPDAPSGRGSATVTFAPNGTPSRVTLSAPFAGSATEACLRATFAAARVPAFEGVARTVDQRFRVASQNTPSTLTFETNVPALVTLDGRSLGPTPKSVTLAAGNHSVVFVHPELGQKQHAVTVAPGQEKTIRATFEQVVERP
jgi:serine/threonine protein kinase